MLSDSSLNEKLRDTLKEVMVKAADNRLDDQPNFQGKLEEKGSSNQPRVCEKDEAFGAAIDIMAFSFVLGKDLTNLSPVMWLQDVKTSFDQNITEEEIRISREIKEYVQTKLKLEVTASLLKSKTSAIEEWKQLKGKKIITKEEVGSGESAYLKVKVAETDDLSLKELFKLLQFYPDIYKEQ